MLQQQLTTVAI